MIGYEASWSTPTVSQSGTAYYCEACKVPMGSLTSDPIHIRGPIVLPADAVCACCLRKPGSDDRAEQPKPQPAAMFGTTQQALLAGLSKLGERHCIYAGGEWVSRRCDCKYGASGQGEDSGCPELRQAYEMVRAMTAAEFAHICSQASISTVQDPADG